MFIVETSPLVCSKNLKLLSEAAVGEVKFQMLGGTYCFSLKTKFVLNVRMRSVNLERISMNKFQRKASVPPSHKVILEPSNLR